MKMTDLKVILTILLSFVNVKSETHFAINVEIYKHQNEDKGNSCRCLPFYLCSEETGEVITDGSGLLDLRTFKNTCAGEFEICCNVSKEDTTIKNTSATKGNEVVFSEQGCGYQHSGLYPWSATLLYQDRNQFNPGHKCGVSIIHNKVVVTAAHCLLEDGFYAVRIGNIIRGISSTVIHPKFNSASLQNDIALLFLDKPIDTINKSAIICIPPATIQLQNASCLATGFVGEKHGNSKVTVVSLPIVPGDNCTKILRSTRLGEYFYLHDSFICAGGKKNQDTCGGDGGNPLICPIPGQPGRFHQVGIVSWGIGCGNNVPGVYVNLPYFRDWIDLTLEVNGLETTSYRY